MNAASCPERRMTFPADVFSAHSPASLGISSNMPRIALKKKIPQGPEDLAGFLYLAA